MRWAKAIVTMVVLCAGTGSGPVFGQDELAILLPEDGELEDYFGSPVAISGNTAAVGMPYDDDNGDNAGAAYVFVGSGSYWGQAAKLLPSDGEACDFFGASVAVDLWYDWAVVVGAPRADDNGLNSGAAYLFLGYGDEWHQAAKLLAYDGASENLFGSSVAISAETIVVGVGGINTVGEYNGSAYVYRFGDGQLRGVDKLVASDGAEAGLFDVRVAVDGDIAVIGAPYDDENGRESGSAYVFRHVEGGWVEEAKLLASDGAARDYFGWSVGVAGEMVVIGARGELWQYGGDPHPGAVYVFRYEDTQWAETAKLETGVSDWFGATLSIDADALVVGAPHDAENGEGSGSTYAYRYTDAGWTQVAKLLPSDAAMWDQFGCVVAVSGNNAVIGALRDDDQGINSGSAYVFEVPAGPACPGDLDGDNDRDLSDLAQLLSNYGTTSGASYEDGDLDGDEDVDLDDLAALLAVYGTSCE
ncbi:MAG: FG-GAP repeat protein [Phycisphaerae bacterium]